MTVFPPGVVWDLRPDVNAKHWPTGDAADLARARRAAATVELQPGDALYVPLMWPHNVDADAFSATANRCVSFFYASDAAALRYLYRADPDAWHEYVDRSKANAWLLYERTTGLRLC